jgi:hypothetical protein
MGELTTWEKRTGHKPGAKKMDNGHKAYQNDKTIVCTSCGLDTGKRENKETRGSDFFREFNIKVHDRDFISSGAVLDYTDLEATSYPYLKAIDQRKLRQHEYDSLLKEAAQLGKPAVMFGMTADGQVCYKSFKDGLHTPWVGPVTKEAFAELVKKADSLHRKKKREDKQRESQGESSTERS